MAEIWTEDKHQALALTTALQYARPDTVIFTHQAYIEKNMRWTDPDLVGLNEISTEIVKMAIRNGYDVI